MFSPINVVAVVVAMLGTTVAALAFGFSKAPGWRELRWFGLVALTAALYVAASGARMFGVSDEVIVWSVRASLAIAAINVACWVRYTAAFEHRERLLPLERWLVGSALAVAPFFLVPGLLLGDDVRHRSIELLNETVADVVPTSLGLVVCSLILAVVAYCALRFTKAARAGQSGARAHVIGLAALLLLAIQDLFVALKIVPGIYLVDLGFVIIVLGVAVVVMRRFVASARALDDLRRELERKVEIRSNDLAAAREDLLRAEKLAALGQIAGGVAHEINNPAAVILTNIECALSTEAARKDPEVRECLDEAQVATKRIANIVRQLMQVGAAVGVRRQRDASAFDALDRAVVRLSAEGAGVRVERDLPPDLRVAISADSLTQVFEALLRNGAYACRGRLEGARLHVAAEVEGGRALIHIADNGTGIPPDRQGRLFEPFFTTKEVGEGSGLGLAAALGIIRLQGGDLRLLETSHAGTTLLLVLPVVAQASRDL